MGLNITNITSSFQAVVQFYALYCTTHNLDIIHLHQGPLTRISKSEPRTEKSTSFLTVNESSLIVREDVEYRFTDNCNGLVTYAKCITMHLSRMKVE